MVRNLLGNALATTVPGRLNVVDEGGLEPTYNLIVADFHTYFVGDGKVLSHDNSIRKPTSALVPGLIPR